ncbi:endospore germination permease [Paenibacillus sp. NPDC056579]|uniref:GerAB/ArcD/ProY family transporter n=1 Tax=Paenibacillus sp. NPDC056579 TaxID=3345871 RepID=UPI0036B02F70
MEQGRISSFQMALLMYPLVVATADVTAPALTFKYAQRDLWLSPVWASIAGVITLWLAVRLERFYPGKTIIQYLVSILGTGLGKAVGLLFLFYYLHQNGNIIRIFQELVVSNFLTFTPMFVVIGGMIIICGCAVRGGLEVIARTAQVFIPIVFLFSILVFVLLIPELSVKKLFPILERGLGPSLKGAIVPWSWFTHFFLLPYIIPYLRDREKGQKWGMISIFAIVSMLVIFNTYTLMLFGSITGKFTYPVMQAARLISIADFLEHVESVVVVIWVAGAYLKIAIYYYVLVLGTAQWLNLGNYKPIVFPLGMLLLVFTLWVAPSLQDLSTFVDKAAPFYDSLVQILIPLLLLLIVLIRNKMSSKKENAH